jgi:hypothetical protein
MCCDGDLVTKDLQFELTDCDATQLKSDRLESLKNAHNLA